MPGILGPDGNPVSRAALEREEGVPSVTGIEHTFDAAISPGLTPARLARTLRDAALGEMHDFITLAEEMEEREPHYRYALETRKNGVTSLAVQVDPASERSRDIEIADFIRNEVVAHPAFAQLADALVDGLAKGYSAIEIIWQTGKTWLPVDYIWRDQRLFLWDRQTRRELRLRSRSQPDGMPLTPLKWLVHVPLLKMGIPARNGLARPAAWAFMYKAFSMRDWAQFLEVYGMPLRVGKWGPGASVQDKAVLLRAVRNLGRDAAAIVPESMNIELVEAKGFSDKPFDGHARFIDEQLTKLILGKPGDGIASSKAGEEVLDKVRIDIKHSDTRDLALTLMGRLVRPVVDLNFGPQRAYPKMHLPIADRKDLQVWSNAVAQLVDRGLEVEQAQIYDMIGLTEPGKGAKLLKAGQTGAKAPPQVPVEKARAYRMDPRVCPACGPSRLAADDPAEEEKDEVDLVVDRLAVEWEPAMAPLVDELRRVMREAGTYEELDAALERLAATLPSGELARRLAVGGMIGRGRGDAGIE